MPEELLHLDEPETEEDDFTDAEMPELEDILPEDDELPIPEEDELPEPEAEEEPEPEEIEEITALEEPEDMEDILPEEEEEFPAADVIEEEIKAEAAVLEEEENPLASLKDAAAKTVGGEAESFDKLKTLSKRIIDGESVDLGLDIKSEISELLRIIKETKLRVDEIGPTLATSNKNLPNVLNALESVTETTEHATLSLMEAADGLNSYYQEFMEEISDLEDLVYKKDAKNIVKKLENLEKDIDQADSLGFNILQALEFQDITEQKIHKVIDAISEIGARIGAILGFIKLKQESDPTAVDDASQEDIDKLLADFGLN